ncbi:hypothetical protein MTR67_007678, partial [Solanum verrucosum]
LFLTGQPNFKRSYLTHPTLKLSKLGGVGKIFQRSFLRYLVAHLTHPVLGVMIISS